MKTEGVLPAIPAERNLADVPCATCGHAGRDHHTRIGHVDLRAGNCEAIGCWCPRFHASMPPVAPLPGEVAIAFRSDICAGGCGREIRVNEPIYRHPGGIQCAACFDAVPEVRERETPRALTATPADMVTSVLLRRAAQLLDIRPYGGERNIIAHELRQRAEMLRGAAERARAGGGSTCHYCIVAVGEVRS